MSIKKTHGWGDIKNPMSSKVVEVETPETATLSDLNAIEEASGLDSVFILTDDGRKIPALVDQSSRTVYPKRMDSK